MPQHLDPHQVWRLLWAKGSKMVSIEITTSHFLPFDEATASRAVFVIVSGSDGRTGGWMDGNAFGDS